MLFISICLLEIAAAVVVTFVGLHVAAVILVLPRLLLLYKRKEKVMIYDHVFQFCV